MANFHWYTFYSFGKDNLTGTLVRVDIFCVITVVIKDFTHKSNNSAQYNRLIGSLDIDGAKYDDWSFTLLLGLFAGIVHQMEGELYISCICLSVLIESYRMFELMCI